jgi:hypothetical protein
VYGRGQEENRWNQHGAILHNILTQYQVVSITIIEERNKSDEETKQGSTKLYLICKLISTLLYCPTYILKLLEDFLKGNDNKSNEYELCVNSNIIILIEIEMNFYAP